MQSSNYETRFAYEPWPGNPREFRRVSAYHGDLTVNPDTGTVLRLTIIAELQSNLAVTQADLVVEYGPKDIGGRTYFCPTKSVSRARAKTLSIPYNREPTVSVNVYGPEQTFVNEVTFSQYQIFRTDMKVVPQTGTEGAP